MSTLEQDLDIIRDVYMTRSQQNAFDRIATRLELQQNAPGAMPSWLSWDGNDTLTINGRRYSAAMFGEAGFLSPPGTLLRIESGADEVVTVSTVQPAPQPQASAKQIAEDIQRDIALVAKFVSIGSTDDVWAAFQRIAAALNAQAPPAAVQCPNLTPTGECIKARMAAQQAYAAGTDAPSAAVDRTGMTYYRKTECKAASAEAPDCICWSPEQAPPAALDENMKLQADAYEIACEDLENWQDKRLAAGKESGARNSLCAGIASLCEMLDEAEAEQAPPAAVPEAPYPVVAELMAWVPAKWENGQPFTEDDARAALNYTMRVVARPEQAPPAARSSTVPSRDSVEEALEAAGAIRKKASVWTVTTREVAEAVRALLAAAERKGGE